ncbi:hypothetical protein EVAR_64269_1 [Eumeta japonica]|uniref:Uncharacterized protein n=1 Tax=Eumeta variegata TaxID=151549 RepID=A0A4C2AAG6_EUMVA|nr:hypothetical protein EVAR_64269_1 [Eumeta japonica]
MSALEEFQSSHNKGTSQQAVQILNTLRSSDFVMCLVIIQKVMSYTLSLLKQLQAVNTDLITAFRHVDDVINPLQLLINKPDNNEYVNLCQEAKVLLEENGGVLRMPRIVGKQQNRYDSVHNTTDGKRGAGPGENRPGPTYAAVELSEVEAAGARVAAGSGPDRSDPRRRSAPLRIRAL